MAYLISQILLCLLFTAALGVIVGWLLRDIGARGQFTALERERNSLLRRIDELDARSRAEQPAAQRAAPSPQPQSAGQSGSVAPAAEEALAALRDRLTQLDAVAHSQAERIADLGHRLREKDRLLEQLQAPEHAAEPRPSEGPSRGSVPELFAERPLAVDRLQTITGVGPVLEHMLNELGIYRFRQLARMDSANIEWLAHRIDWSPQRIHREDWVGQARRLHQTMYPDEEL